MAGSTETIAPTTVAAASQPLRLRLFMLAASALLPLVIAAVLGTVYLIEDRREAAQRSALELSRALAIAVDAELKSCIGVLESLATSEDLASLPKAQFQQLAQRVANQRGWRHVLIADANGNNFLSSDSAVGERVQPAPVDPASMQLARVTGAPVIGRVAQGRLQPNSAFAVRVPIVRDGQVVNVLSAVVEANRILDVLTRQKVPPSWVISVFDQDGIRVARTKFNPTARPSPSMQALMATGAPEGMGPTYTLEGVPTYSGFSRLKDSGWTVAVGISTREVYLALLPLLVSLAAGVLASLVLSGYLAWFFARRVSQPIHTLKSGADALGRGDRVALPPLGVAELDEVGAALNKASAERDAAAAERRKSEAERERLLEAMTEALRMAEEAGRGKDEFLAMLGHELRNPLAPMTNALQLMEYKNDPGTRPERDVMRRQLTHMVRLVDDLLDVSRITGKRFALQLKPLRLAGVVESALDAARPLLGGRTLNVRVAPDAACAWVRADEVRLAQVMNNVLGNAVKFTSDTGRIEVAMFRQGDEVQIEVRDDGIGMAPQVLERAFDPFFQAPQQMDRARGGLGLGLAIVKSLMEMHGGSVNISSAGVGHGAAVMLSLPCIEQPVAESPAAAPATAAGKGRVLVVDDNRDAADTTAALLELAGYEVRAAYHPRTALDLASDFLPGAAVLDIGLPEMSGYELAAALRSAPHHFTGFLVALTGYGEQEDVKHALRSGFDAHLTKPVAGGVLLDLIGARMRRHETESA